MNLTGDANFKRVSLGYAGGLWDRDTGFVRFGARDYDPNTGRWTAKDPIRFDGDDTNLYLYVGGDPVNFTDLAGFAKDAGSDGGTSPCRRKFEADDAACLRRYPEAHSTPGPKGYDNPYNQCLLKSFHDFQCCANPAKCGPPPPPPPPAPAPKPIACGGGR